MKAKELITILSVVEPESDILISTVGYKERNHSDAGYEREKPQKAEGVSISNHVIVINGGKERRV